jgi:uncharacterized DUF497 family protein
MKRSGPNLHARYLDFGDVWQVFDGRPALHVPSSRNNEDRFISIAEINGNFYTAVWTWRGESRRVISFRRASNGEKRAYGQVHG